MRSNTFCGNHVGRVPRMVELLLLPAAVSPPDGLQLGVRTCQRRFLLRLSAPSLNGQCMETWRPLLDQCQHCCSILVQQGTCVIATMEPRGRTANRKLAWRTGGRPDEGGSGKRSPRTVLCQTTWSSIFVGRTDRPAEGATPNLTGGSRLPQHQLLQTRHTSITWYWWKRRRSPMNNNLKYRKYKSQYLRLCNTFPQLKELFIWQEKHLQGHENQSSCPDWTFHPKMTENLHTHLLYW